jgi:excisionase family DNA binding protein
MPMEERRMTPKLSARPSRASRLCPTCGCLPIEWLKVASVAATLNVGKATVWRMAKEGRLSATRLGKVFRIRHYGKDPNGVPGLHEFLAECEEK